ncbi:hypothetical protein CN155_04905 [Sinorhizobium meliloti]|uniref:hypothetical protein n=1 Tax=Rhizobium meliloti TaxID=382 RepID=UPI000FDB4808|nr:hypothetical protein [Sinorhizobium meliloti]RVK60602.1 hypothetical protein CN155_04905 [Sinorhizobium meliloti]
MNRRSFLGFAIGGAVAAPAAILVGERVEGFPKPSAMPATDVARSQAQQVSVMVTGADGDARIRRLVQKELHRAMLEQQRGGIALSRRDQLMRG